ncbi:hypothetical protein ABT314_46090, partial [Streptomyces spiralis]
RPGATSDEAAEIKRLEAKAQVGAGRRPGATSDEAAEIKRLEAKNAGLRRANEILKAASAFFAAEADQPSRRSYGSPTPGRCSEPSRSAKS